jgi:predicted TIM-barrel fold metal-dependent hydrolase
MDMPMAKDKTEPVYLQQMKDVLRRHPNTTIIWAHIGLGRIVHPVGLSSTPTGERSSTHIDVVKGILDDPAMSHVYFDISWDEVAKYIVATPRSIENSARLMNNYPDRFLFGSDVVSPPDQKFYMSVYEMYGPFWKALTPETSEKIRKGNYNKLFDEARKKVRTWEKNNIPAKN